MLVSLVSQGHILLQGNPGLGKTTLAKAFSETIGGDFHRVQMTPDTLPADILGTYVFDQRNSSFELRKGPIFGNVILVDELNRATPKAQAALLEAMQERQVSLEGQTMQLNEPFMVLATQVPFGAPGTYPLSEVQADRFAFSLNLGYPPFEEELKVLGSIDKIEAGHCDVVMTAKEVMRTVEAGKKVFVSDPVQRYIVSIIGHLRESPMFRVKPSARASIALLKGARALALLDGRDHVLPDDVKALAIYVLQHRAFLSAEALSEEVSPESLLKEALEKVPVPKEP
ncbi:MAG: MoxR family ATPase [Nitrososphaerota archaeon]|nr:MoxR family ATPase [Nitrososphaerota archaeon]